MAISLLVTALRTFSSFHFVNSNFYTATLDITYTSLASRYPGPTVPDRTPILSLPPAYQAIPHRRHRWSLFQAKPPHTKDNCQAESRPLPLQVSLPSISALESVWSLLQAIARRRRHRFELKDSAVTQIHPPKNSLPTKTTSPYRPTSAPARLLIFLRITS